MLSSDAYLWLKKKSLKAVTTAAGAAAVLFLLTAVAQADEVPFRDWHEGLAADRSKVAAVTMNDSGEAFGEWCFFSDRKCYWEVLVPIPCEEGEPPVLVLVNGAHTFGAVTLNCLGKIDGTTWAYGFNWKDLESVIKTDSNSEGMVGIAMAMRDSKFRVMRFSLRGMKDATDYMEQRFFTGTKMPDNNTRDVTL